MALIWWWISAGIIILAALAAVFAWFIGGKKSLEKGVPIANSKRLTALPAYRRALGRYRMRAWLLASSLLIVIGFTAIAAGRWVYQKVDIPEKHNRDIVLCLDVSKSMLEYDAEIVDTYLKLLDGFKGDRIAMFMWNSTTAQVFPLTDDYHFVRAELEEAKKVMSVKGKKSLDEYRYFDGTLEKKHASSLVGDGLASCTFGFDNEKDKKRSRSIILATDNEVGKGETVSLPDAAKIAKSKNIKIYGINTSTKKPDKVAEYKAAVAETGGIYSDATDPSAVKKIVDRVNSEDTSAIKGAAQVLMIDRPEFWLIAALGALLLYLLAAWRFKL
ncbi:MAG: VWA domain-containing protein [Microbacteriaceae bacterium]|nr:VWA domain-containing protein [Microbacteriaceae bacterium]